MAKKAGDDPALEIEQTQKSAGYSGSRRAEADKESILRNRVILERLGCLREEGLNSMRSGHAPVITLGPYMGEKAAVDHIIPRSVVPELDEKLFNLEFMPESLNRKKSAKIGQRQIALATQWNREKLLSDDGLRSVEAAYR